MVLKIAARVEFVSLVLLFANLATVHWAAVASLVGPIHGCAYLFVIGATWRTTTDTRTRLLSVVPGIGGLLATARTASKRQSGPRQGGRMQGDPTQSDPTQHDPTQHDTTQHDPTQQGPSAGEPKAAGPVDAQLGGTGDQ